ncbi:MAG TPA: hypothetical protein VLT16_15865 [Candidatus Limnocylindrales bacterium]|nr:hypothetical protein [Candidatus Limnocylindrales bacterium]
MAYALIIACGEFAADAIKQALEQRGHFVISATDFTQVREYCNDLRFDLVIIGEAIPAKVKKALALQLREYCPGSLVLDVCSLHASIAEADYVLKSDSNEALSQSIHNILLERGKRRLG